MFPSLAARETYVAEANFASWKQENVSESSQKHFCFTDANFASETYVSQFSHAMKHVWKQCFRENVSAKMFPSLARPLGSSRKAVGDYCMRD